MTWWPAGFGVVGPNWAANCWRWVNISMTAAAVVWVQMVTARDRSSTPVTRSQMTVDG